MAAGPKCTLFVLLYSAELRFCPLHWQPATKPLSILYQLYFTGKQCEMASEPGNCSPTADQLRSNLWPCSFGHLRYILVQIIAEMSGLPAAALSGPIEDGLSLLQGAGLQGYHLMPSAYAGANFPNSTQQQQQQATLAAHNFLDSANPTSSYGHHHHHHHQQQQQYLESSLLLASQPLLRPQHLHHQLASLVQPGSNLSSLVQPGSTNLSSLVQPSLPLNLNYLNFSLLNSLGHLQAQGIKVKGAILRIISKWDGESAFYNSQAIVKMKQSRSGYVFNSTARHLLWDVRLG